MTDVKGYEIEPVEVISFGSPCQNLSIAGNRKGLTGDQSSLFFEAIRIIKEMREATNGEYPRFAIWENVPGAFSSNKGEDFRRVLEEFIKLCEPSAVMPEVPKAGWAYADSYRGDGWSIAYRTLDAQYWGCAQRRRRIYLVADFRNGCAGEVLFKREGLRGDFAQGRIPWQGASGNAEESIGTDLCLMDSLGGQSERGWEGDIAPTLRTVGPPCISYPKVYCIQGNCIDRSLTAGCNGKGWKEDRSYTLTATCNPAVAYAVDQGGGKSSCNVSENISPTLTCTNDGTPAVCYQEKVGTICAGDYKGAGSQYVADDKCVVEKAETRYLVRRLTPKECAKLQGFPRDWGRIDAYDDFTDEQYEFWLGVRNKHAEINGRKVRSYTKESMVKWYNKLHSDCAEFKMWGNGIALPTALYVMQGIKDVLEDGAVC